MQETIGLRRWTQSELLAKALVDTVAELRLIDAVDLIAYIRAEQWANIADLVQSSAELSFTDDAIAFACAADFEMSWGRAPSISLDLEFQHSDLTVFFTLFLEPTEAKVIVKAVWFDSPPLDENEATAMLAAALATARRQRGPRAPSAP